MKEISALFLAAQKHKGFLDAAQQDADRLRGDLASREKLLQETIQKHDNMLWAYQYLDALVKEESNRFISHLQDVLNSGLKTIFDNRDYQANIVVEDNKRASIHLVYDDENGNRISPDIKDCGGGIRTVVGLLLQIFFLFHYNVEKILIIDEGLSQVSSEYLPNLFGLVDALAKKNHLKVLLITHDSRMTEYASRQYIVDGNSAKLIQ